MSDGTIQSVSGRMLNTRHRWTGGHKGRVSRVEASTQYVDANEEHFTAELRLTIRGGPAGKYRKPGRSLEAQAFSLLASHPRLGPSPPAGTIEELPLLPSNTPCQLLKRPIPAQLSFSNSDGKALSLSAVAGSRQSTVNSIDRPSTSETRVRRQHSRQPSRAISWQGPSLERSPQQPYPDIQEPQNPARKLSLWSLLLQRFAFCVVVLGLNAACIAAALLSMQHVWVLLLILLIKSKDVLSALFAMIVLTIQNIGKPVRARSEFRPKWILSFVSAYSEPEDQILKTINSLLKQDMKPHRQIICVMLDGNPRNLTRYMRRVSTFTRPYVTWKFSRNEITISSGFIGTTPMIVMEKTRNAGKKDGLILCHDLFNFMRNDAPLYTRMLRQQIWSHVLPVLTGDTDFSGIDLIFCTDADTTIYRDSLRHLAHAMSDDQSAVAACGILLAEMKVGAEWSFWHLYQQFQYTFGQFVRRRAEGLWGKVNCLPGCISMISVRPEMAGAIRLYAEPVQELNIFPHQVQYLGTDRRLTYCMLAQSKQLRTLFVPHALCETVAPQNLRHYLSQRRRWASNAYFNDMFYLFGSNQLWVTRAFAFVELVRLTLVYYRVANTALFIHGLVHHFVFLKIVPLLVVTQIPALWYVVLIIFREPILRQRGHKLAIGFFINKLISPILSILVFSRAAMSLGSQAWGVTGQSTSETWFAKQFYKVGKRPAQRISVVLGSVPLRRWSSTVSLRTSGQWSSRWSSRWSFGRPSPTKGRSEASLV